MKVDHDNPPARPAAATKRYTRPLDIRHGRVDMGHGAGGKAAAQLIEELFLPALDNPFLRQGDDGAALPLPAFDPAGGRLVMATDGHVISPLFFPGGDIGCLSVHGTVNDVAMSGARPKPCDAFSPFTTTKSRPHAVRRLGSRSVIAARPARPITSPRKSIFMVFGLKKPPSSVHPESNIA